MRRIKEIQADLAAAKADWNENSGEMPANAARLASENIKQLTTELGAAIAEGARPCPECGAGAHGVKVAGGYEIGCLSTHNPPLRARGETREDAVDAWNAGDYYVRVQPA